MIVDSAFDLLKYHLRNLKLIFLLLLRNKNNSPISSDWNYTKCLKPVRSIFQDPFSWSQLWKPCPRSIAVLESDFWNMFRLQNIHLMYGPEGNSLFCFPESPDEGLEGRQNELVSRGTIHYFKCFVIHLDFPLSNRAVVFSTQATTAELYPGHLNLIRGT